MVVIGGAAVSYERGTPVQRTSDFIDAPVWCAAPAPTRKLTDLHRQLSPAIPKRSTLKLSLSVQKTLAQETVNPKGLEILHWQNAGEST